MLCDKIIAARNQRNLCEPRISVLFDPVRTANPVIYPVYPAQLTKQVRLLFRSLRIFTLMVN